MRATGSCLGAIAIAIGSGCAGTVTTAGGTDVAMRSPQFEAYVERVFRHQNRLATELAFALEDIPPDSARYRRLLTAEQLLLGACAELNALAAARRDGRRPGWPRLARMARTTPDCERAAVAAEAVLAAP